MPEKPSLGRVTSVDASGGETTVDVETGPTRSEQGIRFASLAPGFQLPPKEGDMVEVYETEKGKFARFSHSTPTYDMPDLEDDSFILRFGQNTEIMFSNDGNGNYTVTLKGNDSVTIESESEVNIKGTKVNFV